MASNVSLIFKVNDIRAPSRKYSHYPKASLFMAEVAKCPHFLHDTFVAKDYPQNPHESQKIPPDVPLSLDEKAAHDPPAFDESHGEEEILYLPPLLSSLPHSHLSTSEDGHKGEKNVPLRTETHLPSIDPVSLSLHRALHKFKPHDSYYASEPYGEAFNWANLDLPVDEEREWYCVAFRSRRKTGSDSGPLYEQDRLAHEEAVHRGGLLMYWYGVPNPKTGLNLATCIWQSRKFAVAATSGPQHILAMKLAVSSFAEYRLERYVLKKEKGVRGLIVYPYTGGDIGW